MFTALRIFIRFICDKDHNFGNLYEHVVARAILVLFICLSIENHEIYIILFWVRFELKPLLASHAGRFLT